MRIGVDGRVLTDRYPGIGRAIHAVIPPLVESEDEIVVIRGPEPESDRFPLSDLAGSDLEVHRVSFGLRTMGEQLRLAAAVEALRLDVVLTPYFATALRWPCPRVTMVHDVIPLTVEGGMPSALSRLAFRWLLGITLRRSQVVIAPSQATADHLVEFGPPHGFRVRVVPHAVAARFRPVSAEEVNFICSRHGLERPYVLTVAGDRPHKNLGSLVAAWCELDDSLRRGAVLVLAGSPAPRVEGETVRVLGVVPDDDLPALYTGATMVAVPSLDEGFGLPAAEAMACHTAVVCSDRPALREVVGDAALTFDPCDRTSIAETIARALADRVLLDSLERRGAVRVADYAPEVVAARLIEVLRVAARGGA